MPRPNKLSRLADGRYRTCINGKYHYLGRDGKKAIRLFHELMATHRPGQSTLKGKPKTISGLVAQYFAAHPEMNRRWDLRPFILFTAGMSVSDIHVDLLRQYAQHLKDTGFQRNKKRCNYRPKTIRDYCSTARAVLHWGHEHGWVKTIPPFPRIAKPMRSPKDISPEALQQVVRDTPTPARFILEFIALTGCRPGEARKMQWKMVDLAGGRCTLLSHKTSESTGRPRIIYLTDPAHALLQRLNEQRNSMLGDDWVFPSRTGKPYTAGGLRSIFRRRGITPYQLRHTFAQLASEHLLPQELAKLLNHEHITTTQFYYSVKDQRASTLARRLPLPTLGVDNGSPDQPTTSNSAK